MKPVNWISKDAPLAETSSAGRSLPANGLQTTRERYVVSGLNPLEPLPPLGRDPVRPAREVFKQRRAPAETPKTPAAPQDVSPASQAARNDASRKKPASEEPAQEPSSPPEEAATKENEEPLSLKLPIQAQLTLIRTIMTGRQDFVAVALEQLQSSLRNIFWPGVLRIYRPDMESSESGPADVPRATAPLVCGEENYGSLVLEGTPPNPRTVDQLRQAALWLAAMLSIAHKLSSLQQLADTDELSGAFNRRYFMENVPKVLERARRERFCVTILLFDIDNFKQYNDQFGHAAGDAIIREIIGLLRHCTRTRDMVARIGGDEFAVVFWDEGSPRHPDSQHPRNVLTVAHRFRKAVEDHPWNTEGGPIAGKLSISGGLATFPWDAQNLHDLMIVADGELMRAKSLGKNAIVLAGPEQSPPTQPNR
ncbi:MAG TPA: GGDEF domain-containing protein [Phycisphaerae bacterium]|nr:GGDEF domain-containing protein [Phycisphaerae bacterium]